VTSVTDGRRRGAEDDITHSRKERRMFKTNVGGLDRIARILAGLVLLALTLTGVIGAWGWIGLVPLATGLLSTCPLYSVLGFNTCPLKT
jgi:hypothetical protein